ncbi:MAG: TonB-dependent receptor [Syntrophothermus sp.]
METPRQGNGRQHDEPVNQRLLFHLVFLILIFFIGPIRSQPVLYSSIRGTILDRATQSPLIGATIVLVGSEPVQGTVSDENGNFHLEQVSIGKKQLKVTYVGYSPFVTDYISVNSGKTAEVVISMEESMITGEEVEIKGDYRKYEAINKMATIGIRSFSIDETSRFAGSYNDPARMVQNFAGVTSGVDNRNDIIVRGNSPMGLQWRLDEMEIPNPNHFAAVGTTGGPVTVLNNNLLTNSDFFMGTFPAQYGNALAGVFDMRMRNGNNEKREYWFGIGWNGLEFGTEGPFAKNSRSSYLFSYRYSLLELLSLAGVKLNMVPKYNDLNFKITIPTKKAGQFAITGMGGISYIELFDSKQPQNKWMFSDYGEDLANGSDLGVLGISHQIFPHKNLQLKNMIYVVSSLVTTKIDTFSNVALTPSPWAGERSSETKFSYSSKLTKKFSAANTFETGVNADYFILNYADSLMKKGSFMVNTGSRENMFLLRGYVQWKHDFSRFFIMTSGLTGTWLTMNGTWAADPRIGFSWELSKKNKLNFGGGIYSQTQPRVMYFVLTRLTDGTIIQTNKNLDLTRNAQAAVAYELIPAENLHLKTEIYYQYLFNVPVKASIPQYSLINQGHEFFLDRQYSDSLVNRGSAINQGIEITVEHFFAKNFFYLFTCSLFDSKYSGYDEISRKTAFDVNYVLNAAGGYEFVMGRRKWGVISFGARATWTGGNPYIPFDVAQTVQSGEAVPDWSRAYEVRYPEYQRYSFRFGIKRNMPGYNLEFMLDLQYRTNYTNVYLERINPSTGEIRNFFGMGFFPMGTWRLQF